MRLFKKLTFEQFLEEMYAHQPNAVNVLFSGVFSREASSRELYDFEYSNPETASAMSVVARVLSDGTIVARAVRAGYEVDFYIGREQ